MIFILWLDRILLLLNNRKNEKMKRESNIELLRLLCMFLIIVNHMLGHGVLLDPTVAGGPMELLCYDIGSSIWMPAALVFILISGYFGIHPTMKGIARFAFVCTFYLVISGLMGGGKKRILIL